MRRFKSTTASGDRPPAGDDQDLGLGLGACTRQRVGHTGHEVGVGGHPVWLAFPGHPSQQAIAQQAEVVSHCLGRVRWRYIPGVDGAHHRFAVVLVQARQHARLGQAAHPLGDALEGLAVAAQGACEHGIEALALAAEVGAQALALTPA